MNQGELLHSSMGGEVRRDGARTLFSYPGRLVTVLMAFPLLIWTLGSMAMVVGAVQSRQYGLLGGALLGFLASTAFLWLVRRRMRCMGSVVVDPSDSTVVFVRWGGRVERWPLRVVDFDTAWDPFHRGFDVQHWLVARVPDGRKLRLAKGTMAEMTPLLVLLKG